MNPFQLTSSFIPFMLNRRLLPYAVDGAFKQSLMSLFRLAWSNKLQLPLLITICFMTFDIRLQIEINIFWERQHVPQQRLQPIVQQEVYLMNEIRAAPLAEEESDTELEEDQIDREVTVQSTEVENILDESDDEDQGGTPLVVQVEFRNS